MTTPEPLVLMEVDGPLTTLVLNRPAKLNAVQPAMLRELEIALDRIEMAPDTCVVILTGAGDRAFSAGADIEAWSALSAVDMWRTWVPAAHRVLDRLARLRQPVIAVINGIAFGGGLELALAADLRVAADTARFGMPEVSLGTVPGWGGIGRLPGLVGGPRAKQLILTGHPIDASTALGWGLVNEVASKAELASAARSWADRIAGQAPVAVQAAKQLIDAGAIARSSTVLEAVGGAFVAGTGDATEGIAAFRERRPPTFRGT